jgi:ABC-type uncharacterized transport system permease subunit
MNTSSIIELTLGATGTHSTLALTGTYSFQLDQTFTFINAGATTGTYDNIITGVALTGDASGWTVTNAGFSWAFTYDGAGDIDLNLSSVPEPSTWAGASLALVAMLVSQRRRLRRLIARRAS